jgi:hypothetical protein
MLGQKVEEFGITLMRVGAPLCMSGWMPVQINRKHRLSPFRQFQLIGEIDLVGDLLVRATEPVLYTDGRYVLTTSGDEYLLENHNACWTPPKGFSADDPFGAPRFHGPLRFGRWQAELMDWHRHSAWVRGLTPPARLVDWTAFTSSSGIKITGFVIGDRVCPAQTRVTFNPVFTLGRYVKAADGRDFVLYEPDLEFRKAMGGHNPRQPLIGLERRQ